MHKNILAYNLWTWNLIKFILDYFQLEVITNFSKISRGLFQKVVLCHFLKSPYGSNFLHNIGISWFWKKWVTDQQTKIHKNPATRPGSKKKKKIPNKFLTLVIRNQMLVSRRCCVLRISMHIFFSWFLIYYLNLWYHTLHFPFLLFFLWIWYTHKKRKTLRKINYIQCSLDDKQMFSKVLKIKYTYIKKLNN